MCTDRNRERDADPSMPGLNDLRVERALLVAACREAFAGRPRTNAALPHDAQE
jgi:hypothetical protein